MGGFSSPRPLDADKHNFLGIELEAPVPDGYGAMEQIFSGGKFKKNIAVQHQEGEVCCLVPQEDYKPVLEHIMKVRQKLGHYSGSEQCQSHSYWRVDPVLYKHDPVYYERMTYFLKPLEEREFEVGFEYGIHVHVDIRNRNKGVVHAALCSPESRKALSVFRGPWRKKADVTGNYGDIKGAVNLEREDYKTAEVRFLDSNYDFVRTCKYIDLILEIVADCEKKKLVKKLTKTK